LAHRIAKVEAGSPAQRAGICDGDLLVAIGPNSIIDMVDYEYLSAESQLQLTIEDACGAQREVIIEKEAEEPLGLSFETTLMSPIRSCKNHCIFCFIDQMPKGVRNTLHFKDDDWRLSFIMGNYVTLTNVDEEEFSRILERRVAPLYVSVHATDPQVRIAMMKNPTAGKIMERLTRLKEAGLTFHCQIVACPGINDGDVLRSTLQDLCDLYPAMGSVAVVPVGLTQFREGLTPLKPYTQEQARDVLDIIHNCQELCKKVHGTPLVYASDEFYLLADLPLPEANSYGEFEQLENGVGLLRLFEQEFLQALKRKRPVLFSRRIAMAGGISACSFLTGVYEKLKPYRIHVNCYPIRNDYFGPSVTVGGLITGGDLIAQLKGKLKESTLIIPRTMLREGEEIFLDGTTLSQVRDALGVRVLAVAPNGDDYIEAIWRN